MAGAIVDGVQFRLLGPVGVWHAGRLMGPVEARQRTVLALLLLDAGRAVPSRRLERALWYDAPVESAAEAVRGHVARLRRLLGPLGGPELVDSPEGYRLLAHRRQVDLFRFRELVRRALAGDRDPERAAALLRSALALWHGPALADVAGRWLPEEVVPGIEEERLSAVEKRAEFELLLGRQQEVASELRTLAAQHPLRERLLVLLMAALHRNGARADALAVYRRARERFAEDLGIEPGGQLRRTYEAITGGRELPLDLIGEEFRAGLGTGTPPSEPTPVPRQLPPDTETFTGRDEELAALDGMFPTSGPRPSGRAAVCVITGAGGIGKTALAVHWAHRARRRFPDGQLHVDLLGFGPTQLARPTAETVRLFLDALGVPPQRIPVSVEAQVGLYRSLMTGRRMLILLDNVADSDQVRPLLPGAPGCLVLVTSRVEPTALVAAEGARTLPLDVLSAAQSRELLLRRLGAHQVAGDDENAVGDIVSQCAGLPLALAIVAARAQVRPGFALHALTAGLEGTPPGLDVFDGGDPTTNVRTVFSWSYRALSREAARLFRLLGLLRGPEISVSGAASLAGLPVRATNRLLAELSRAHLVIERSPGRYGWHDLLWAYARELTEAQDSGVERHEARHRLLDHYLTSAGIGGEFLDEHHRIPLVPAPPRPGVTPARITDEAQARAWFGREYPVLLAAIRQAQLLGFDAHAWQLACVLRGYLTQQGRLEDQATAHRIALTAAGRLDDPNARAHAHLGLGQALFRLGSDGEGEAQLRSALALFGQTGNVIGQAVSHIYLSMRLEREGDHVAGLHHNEEALRLYRQAGHRAGEARSMNNMGWFHAKMGAYERALRCCEEALDIQREQGNLAGEAAAQDSLGYIHHLMGRHERAIAYYEQALRFRRDARRLPAGLTLSRLGEAQLAAGRHAAGLATLRRALELLDELAPTEAAPVRARIAELTAESENGADSGG
ncbi:AfsR/SARP family transcriptional regulator [Streptomyces hainanensis]|uniref:Tetratricopeptide repeat protein n=1 Tax=Streptomyces hainanensis TaxID=402648 RepID=A0A4R4TDH0_9ACTN|nr:BTAD domain-containing putative transcriptional regulator [Streptomyces hainanensis]TDC73202.1 tetratricopeptide repeat protein [Streptomyces hainanensis]